MLFRSACLYVTRLHVSTSQDYMSLRLNIACLYVSRLHVSTSQDCMTLRLKIICLYVSRLHVSTSHDYISLRLKIACLYVSRLHVCTSRILVAEVANNCVVTHLISYLLWVSSKDGNLYVSWYIHIFDIGFLVKIVFLILISVVVIGLLSNLNI